MAEVQLARSRPSRRTVLKAALWSAGTALATPLLIADQTTSLVGLPLKVGVIVPQTSRYPGLAGNVVDGMRLSLDHAARVGSPAITMRPALYDRSVSSVQQALHTLIERDKVDLVVGAFDAQTAASLRPTLEQQRLPLITVDSGANLIRSTTPSPYITHNTLHHWQSSWALGAWAAGSIGRNAVVVASFYESGYDALYTFELGFAAAGGVVQNTHITHAPSRATDLKALLNDIAKAQPDVVYAMYSGAEAIEFVAAYTASSLAGQVPLLGPGFLIEDGVLTAHGQAAVGVRSALPWTATLDTSLNRQFIARYQRSTQRVPDTFAALGYDTASLIVEAARKSDRLAQLPEALADVSFTGPRGAVHVDPVTRTVNAPIYLGMVQQQNLKLQQSTISTLLSVSLDDHEIKALTATPKTGWLYPYLVA